MGTGLPPMAALAVFVVSLLVGAGAAFLQLRPDAESILAAWSTGALVVAVVVVWIVNPGPIVSTDLADGSAVHRIGVGVGVFMAAITAITLLRLTRLRSRYRDRDLARGHSG